MIKFIKFHPYLMEIQGVEAIADQQSCAFLRITCVINVAFVMADIEREIRTSDNPVGIQQATGSQWHSVLQSFDHKHEIICAGIYPIEPGFLVCHVQFPVLPEISTERLQVSPVAKQGKVLSFQCPQADELTLDHSLDVCQ